MIYPPISLSITLPTSWCSTDISTIHHYCSITKFVLVRQSTWLYLCLWCEAKQLESWNAYYAALPSRYILSIESAEEIEEYVGDLLQGTDGEKRLFIDELLCRWRRTQRQAADSGSLYLPTESVSPGGATNCLISAIYLCTAKQFKFLLIPHTIHWDINISLRCAIHNFCEDNFLYFLRFTRPDQR